MTLNCWRLKGWKTEGWSICAIALFSFRRWIAHDCPLGARDSSKGR